MGDITSPTFLNGSFTLALGSDPNNTTSDAAATETQHFKSSTLTNSNYHGRIITASSDFVFASKHNKYDVVNGEITVFKDNKDDPQTYTEVQNITSPTQYVLSTNPADICWGTSMAVDNNYLVIGASNHKGVNETKNYVGAIAIYKKDNNADTWTLQQWIEGPSGEASTYFGFAVAISNG
jgi:hypothetical protein